MASCRDIKVNLTTCSICFEKFKCPKSLPCLHTFCEDCISSYIISAVSKQGSQKGTFNCPICRLTVTKPGGVEIENWGKRLPSNHIIVTIMDYERMKENTNCNWCEVKNETESASHVCLECTESLCDNCANLHTKYKFGRSHSVVKIDEFYSEDFQKVETMKCPNHSDKISEAYCADHDVTCCITCVTIEHRKCEGVSTVSAVADEIRKSSELSDLQRSLTEVNIGLQKMRQDTELNVQGIHESSKQITSEMETVKRRIIAHLNDIQREALEELEATKKEILPELESKMAAYECQMSVASTSLDMLGTGLKYASDGQLLSEIKRLREKVTQLRHYVQQEEKNNSKYVLTFKLSETIATLEEKIKAFGSIVKQDTKRKTPDIDMLKGETRLVRTFEAGGDFFTGGQVLDDGRILVANYMTNQLQLFDENGRELSVLMCDSSPWSLNMIEQENGIVSVYNQNLLVFFTIVDKTTLKEIKRQTLSQPCFDVRHYKDNLYVACSTEIQVLDMTGQKVRSLTPLSHDAHFLDIYPPTGELCYTSNTHSTLTCISLDGTQVFQYTSSELNTTSGVTYDLAGNVYVAGYSSSNVLQLTPEGKLNKIIVQGLSKPFCLRFKQNSNQFLTIDNGHVKVYEVV